MRGRTYILALTSLVALCCAVAFSQEKSRENKEDREYDGNLEMKGKNGESGTLLFCEKSPERLYGKITLKRLKPSRIYVLTINGKPGKPGNDILKNECKQFNDEGYCDVTKITTDSKGEYEGTFKSRELSPSKYDVKFLVKDKDDHWRVILNDDDMIFTIEKPKKK